ncbi:MAG TPA: GtrA family protein [Solirubrobacterales bacterium]|nr:GtrA family protein [Solirubrobacterales bacterium]
MRDLDGRRAPGAAGGDEPTARAAEWTWRLVRRIGLGTRRPANWYQLFKFGLVGASGYVINLTVFALLTNALDAHHVAAAVIAFCVAVSNNFIWNRTWTFRATDGHPGFQAARFLTVAVIALGLNVAVLELLVSAAGLRELPAQAIAVAVAMPVNFIGNKLWTFG